MAHEHLSRLVFSSPIVSIGEFRCPPGDPAWSTQNRVNDHEIVFPRVGVRIRHEGRESVIADPNCVMFYNAGQVYRRALLSDRGDECEYFTLPGAIAVDAVAAFDPSARERPDRPFAFDHGPSTARSYLAQRRLYLHANGRGHGAPDDLKIQETFLLILADALAAAHAVWSKSATLPLETSRAHAAAAEGVKEILSSRTSARLRLDDISDAVELSPFHLCRIFRSRTGMPIHRYLNRLRLRTALERLGDPRVSLARLALELGFAAHGHFTSAFRREFGLTPSAVRRDFSNSLKRELGLVLDAPARPAA